ncbi:SGNH/GDSL hydrolase family protein [Lyngbya sp. CCY1209]|uniref:SGNH/GDSL hydrolase family protein n=1 Tax=Lyngbya sp. CCY1209 TaxID=2886103 RepID=UPI002D20AE06|nr:SGNH/GDSL hydrolase family protein [Lyngbya sp. CCY1209]MEB3886741.1 SGNH/GDSL hydrolase family protein [Lyngbya sp. CCY1209]
MKRSKLIGLMGSAFVAIVAAEILLRFVLGLGNPVLFQADPKTGYRFKPDQNITRFFRRVQYNQYSQRSEPTTSEKPPDTFRILMTGDSILNGRNSVDQSETISEFLERQLADQDNQKIEVLNASAGSWGIGNQLGYLLQFGLFESDLLIVEIGSHDLTQPTRTGEPVGRDPNFPDRKPRSALSEAWNRYLWPRLAPQSNSTPADAEPPTRSELDAQFQDNLTSLQTIVELAEREDIPAVVILIPELRELTDPAYTFPRKSDFLKQLNGMNVPVIDFYRVWSGRSPELLESYFDDGLHLTPAGNRAIADEIAEKLAATDDWQPQK